ncbi:MAG: hypothetical protein U5R06_02160 [candidate division KSB1 bacterium]|nr:hypothetical protein [candidate division KSB1 bacterium]
MLKSKKNLEWENKRAYLNHDILGNQLRNEVQSLLYQKKYDEIDRLESWLSLEDEYRKFIKNAIEYLPPTDIVDSCLFNGLNQEEKYFYKEIIYEIYMRTTKLDESVKKLDKLLTEAILSIKEFINTENSKRTDEMLLQVQKTIDSLSTEISKLPHVKKSTN